MTTWGQFREGDVVYWICQNGRQNTGIFISSFACYAEIFDMATANTLFIRISDLRNLEDSDSSSSSSEETQESFDDDDNDDDNDHERIYTSEDEWVDDDTSEEEGEISED